MRERETERRGMSWELGTEEEGEREEDSPLSRDPDLGLDPRTTGL